MSPPFLGQLLVSDSDSGVTVELQLSYSLSRQMTHLGYQPVVVDFDVDVDGDVGERLKDVPQQRDLPVLSGHLVV